MTEKVLIYTDGGAINNPGRAAIGVVIIYENKTKTYSQEIGIRTNNQAEYEAVIFALNKIKQILGRKKILNSKIILHIDSELVGRQIRGEAKILDTTLQKYFIEVHNLKIEFPNLEIKIIPREENTKADLLVKEILMRGKKLF